MNRLKIVLFALVALGVLGYLLVVSPAAANKSVELAAGAVNGAGPAVGLKIEAQRSLLQAAVLKLSTSPAMWNVGPKAPATKLEAPNAERFNAVRQAVTEGLSDGEKDALWVVLTNEAGSLVAKGNAEPGAAPEGFDVAALAQAGAAGTLASPGNITCLFYGVPFLISDKNEVRTAGQVLVGLPVLPEAKQLEAVAKELKLSTLAVVSANKVVLAAGSEKVQADTAVKTLKVGQVQALVVGSVRELGPIALPLFIPTAAHSVGSRQAIAGTPFEVVAVTSTREPLDALAGFQTLLLFALGGVLLLSITFTVLVKNIDHDDGGGMVVPPPMPLPPVAKKDSTREMPVHPHGPEASPEDFHFPEAPPSSNPSMSVPVSMNSTLSPMMVPPPPPVATGQNPAFPGNGTGGTGQTPMMSPFGGTGTAPLFEPDPEPEQDPFEAASPSSMSFPPPASFPPAPPPAPVPQAPAFPSTKPISQPGMAAASRPSISKPPPPVANPFDDDESGRTVAYPIFKPSAPGVAAPAPAAAPPSVSDPFAMAAGQMADEQPQSYEDNPDATRVAAVPQELIKAARQSGMTGERPVVKTGTSAAQPMPKVSSVIAPAVSSDPEERHFQEVFRDFVSTREKCGEAADGLTFEKFKTKLMKNKEQLVTKYQCRTVRFQVYVKEGKAALKATPVKD